MKKTRRAVPFAKKAFGQNFLVSDEFADRIVAQLTLQPQERVVEIGPGRGALTRRLLAAQASVTAIELDRDMADLLDAEFGGHPNFRLVREDALDFDFAVLAAEAGRPVKLVANLPYYISTAILQRLIEQREAFKMMVLMFQREVVRRLAAQPGDSERGFLTVLAEAYLRVEHLFDVPPSAFQPAPKVWSSVARLAPIGGEVPELADFRRLVGSAFEHKRKTILNNLKTAYPGAAELLATAQIESSRRAEALSSTEWLTLYRTLREGASMV